MKDILEIIVSTIHSDMPKPVKFEELYGIKDDVISIIFLWNHNSYFVNVKERTFIINGGRKMNFPATGKTKLLYRKRTAETVAITGAAEGSNRVITWLVGFEDEVENKLFLQISEDGKHWTWANAL